MTTAEADFVGGMVNWRPLPKVHAAADGGVDEVHTRGFDRDADLLRRRGGIGHVLVAQVLRRPEGVLADGAHGYRECVAHHRGNIGARPLRLRGK